MATAAERQRRYRRHSKGDHTLCDPKRCSPDQAPNPTAAPSPREQLPAAPPVTQRDCGESREAQLGPRGHELWSQMHDAGLGPAHRVLLYEACRIADRLDRLDAMLAGREDWVRLQSRDGDAAFVVVVDALLAEARQQASALRGLVGELRQALPASKKSSSRSAGSETSSKGAAGVADLAARAARRRAAAG